MEIIDDSGDWVGDSSFVGTIESEVTHTFTLTENSPTEYRFRVEIAK